MVRTLIPSGFACASCSSEGRIGELRSVVGVFSYFNVDPANIRNRASAAAAL